jgi:hypothetical protein
MTIQELGEELGVPWIQVKDAIRTLGFDRGWTEQYSPDECERVRQHIMEEREREAKRAAEKDRVAQEKENRRKEREDLRKRRAEEHAQAEARRKHRAQREPLAIFSAQVPVSVVPRIRKLSLSMSTPEHRVTHGEILSMAMDALARELANDVPTS